MTRLQFAFRAIALAAAICFALPAAANFGAPTGDPCKKFKKNSREWKECKGQLKPSEVLGAEILAKGYWLAKTGDYAKALEVLKSHPDQNDTGVLTMTGYATRHLGRVDEALGYYGKALALNPNLTNTRQYLGEAYLQKYDANAAKVQLAEIARICGSEACQDYRDLAREIAAHG